MTFTPRIIVAALLLSSCCFGANGAGAGIFEPRTALAATAASPSVRTEFRQVSADNKSFAVSLVSIDLLDPTLQIEPIVAAGGIGHDEDMASMVERSHAVAAVNGTFFNSYEQDDTVRYPNGLIVDSGAIVHSGDNQALIISSDKTAAIRQVSVGVKAIVTHGGKTYTISPWGVNKYYGADQTDQVVLYTPAFGGGTIAFPGGMNVVVDGGRVVQMTQDPVAVPEDGYVIFVGLSDNNRSYLLPNVHVGDTAAVVQSGTAGGGSGGGSASGAGEAIDPRNWLAAIGVGPKLVTGGAVDVDFERDGFTDPKITTQAGQRSFVGVDADGRLVMGTVSGATLTELADVALALGLTDAMNMDGGSSSALYANGTMLTKPGRRLSNILAVRKLDNPAVQIAVGGAFRPDYRGFIAGETTMVPFRPLLESMRADFRWDDASRTLIVKKGADELRLQPDRKEALLAGAVKTLEAAPVIVDGHLYVPLRFVVETYGGTVSWDGRLYRVDVKLP
jgi:exopolysaccharide biosynthesis protein